MKNIQNISDNGRFFICENCCKRRLIGECTTIENQKICMTCEHKYYYDNGLISFDIYNNAINIAKEFFRNSIIVDGHEIEEFLENL